MSGAQRGAADASATRKYVVRTLYVFDFGASSMHERYTVFLFQTITRSLKTYHDATAAIKTLTCVWLMFAIVVNYFLGACTCKVKLEVKEELADVRKEIAHVKQELKEELKEEELKEEELRAGEEELNNEQGGEEEEGGEQEFEEVEVEPPTSSESLALTKGIVFGFS
jgi:hypothetical protein